MERNSPNKPKIMKANAVLCPFCCVEYAEVEFDFEVDGFILNNVKALRCPTCGEEFFTPKQYAAVMERINKL